MLEYIILGILCRESLTGYDIRKQIDQGVGMFYKASYGSIYPILNRLLAKQWVTGEETMKGKKRSICYTVTETGMEEFMQWLRTPAEPQTAMEAFMARVFFMDRLPKAEASSQIERYEKELKKALERLYLQREDYRDLPNKEQFYHKLSTLYYGICKLQSILAWCALVKEQDDLERLINND